MTAPRYQSGHREWNERDLDQLVERWNQDHIIAMGDRIIEDLRVNGPSVSWSDNKAWKSAMQVLAERLADHELAPGYTAGGPDHKYYNYVTEAVRMLEYMEYITVYREGNHQAMNITLVSS